MAVIETDIDEALEELIDDREDVPHAHIYDYRDYPVALCGHIAPVPIEDNPELPWFEGLYDCKECWSIEHTLQDIDSL